MKLLNLMTEIRLNLEEQGYFDDLIEAKEMDLCGIMSWKILLCMEVRIIDFIDKNMELELK